MRKPHLALCEIQLFKLNHTDVALLKEPDKYGIPPYCLNDNGCIIDSNYFYQFVDKNNIGTDVHNYLFWLRPIDTILSEECSNAGVDCVLERIDMRPIFDKLVCLSVDEIHRTLHKSQYLVIEMYYIGGIYPDYDYDLEIKIHGYLSENMELIKI